MKISHNWLNDFINLDESPEKVSEVLTQVGLEVEGIEQVEKIKGGLAGLLVGEVVSCIQHPNADKLSKTRVDLGSGEPVEIVCGAPNVAEGQKVIVAPVNTTIYPTSGDPFKIKRAKIRGEVSEGMICAEDEIGLGEEHDGIIVLQTDKPNGTPAAELFELGEDTVYEIGLTPNRGDAASHYGTARDLKAFFQKEISLPTIEIASVVEDNPIKVTVENYDACPRYSGVTIRGVKVQTSPDWLQFRLKSIGLTPINNIVDITNYVLHGLGQPLHAFDADKIDGNEVVVKTLPEGTTFVTLDEKERKLSANDLMICDTQQGMCIAGVFGGIHSGITEDTTSIFLESAYFSADWVRATAQRHSLSTDASFRYERGTDPEMTMVALQFATSLICEMAEGKIASQWIDIYPQPVRPRTIATNYDHFEWLIGKKIPNEEIKSILESLDIEIQELGNDSFEATVPPYRSEVTRPADLVEEVLRIHGINNVEIDENFATDFLAEFKEKEPHNIRERISHFLAGQGYHEIFTNSLTNADYGTDLKVGGKPVEILNKSSAELGVLKTSPLYTNLEVLRHNINRKQPNLRFFEFSKSYEMAVDGFAEQEFFCALVTGGDEESWLSTSQSFNYHTIAGGVLGVLDHLNTGSVSQQILPETDIRFEYGVSLSAQGAELGVVGKLADGIVKYFDIGQEVFYAEINWNNLLRASNRKIQYSEVSKFPEVRRDLSLVLDQSISFREIEAIAFKSEKKLLTRVNVFSVYEGDRIEKGKKSYAISFFLQDRYKTLNDKQIDRVMDILIKRYEEELGAVIRR